MLPEDDLIPILPIANAATAPEAGGEETALEGVELADLLVDLDAEATSVDLGALFDEDGAGKAERVEIASLEPPPAAAPTSEGFAVSLPASLLNLDDGSFDGGIL